MLLQTLRGEFRHGIPSMTSDERMIAARDIPAAPILSLSPSFRSLDGTACGPLCCNRFRPEPPYVTTALARHVLHLRLLSPRPHSAEFRCKRRIRGGRSESAAGPPERERSKFLPSRSTSAALIRSKAGQGWSSHLKSREVRQPQQTDRTKGGRTGRGCTLNRARPEAMILAPSAGFLIFVGRL